ncbi:hypothetical protein PQX77_005161 [Marasmius sp. AFHP31]|nr:hypothetical protein PQX77_005161 [Marasmius sp. AFHP31]
MVENCHSGSGTQNNYNATRLNTNHGRDQINGGEVYYVSGDFVSRNHNANPHNTLWDAVADVGASHNAEQQYERGRCLEGTRVELLRGIREWTHAGAQGRPLCWLTGAAGVGKTAIAMTVARACEEEGALVSSFFFFRFDPKRNNPKSLMLAIAYDLASTIPSVRQFIEERISKDRRILEATMEDQFRELVLDPLLQCRSTEPPSTSQLPNIVIIDGLDECSDESKQLRILKIIQDAAQQAPHFPLRFLICSRPEAWIKEAFDIEPFRRLSKVILVDKAFEDIIQYCRHHFQKIVADPKYKHVQFPKPWPSQEDFDTLVDQSCSQFVYVTTVFRFITLGGNHPVEQFRLILQRSPDDPLGTSPFHELDTLYRMILETSARPEKVLAILGAILILPSYLETTPAHIELLLGLPTGQVNLTLREMHAVLHVGGSRADEIHIHHTSFRDYLVDRNRSQSFHIDLTAQKPLIAEQWLQKLATSRIQEYRYEAIIRPLLPDYDDLTFINLYHLQIAAPTNSAI